MRAYEFLPEGGWDTLVTQDTVIHPSIVKNALTTVEKLVAGFNQYLEGKGIPPIRIGAPTGSSAHHETDPEEKIYGDIDLQIVVPELEELKNKTTSQFQGFWAKLIDEYIKQANLEFVHQEESIPGHPVVSIGDNKWVQVDLMPHTKELEKWGRFRTTPERGLKGLLMGNMFSVLGELLMMSIQHNGVQFKSRDGVKLPYATTRKNYELITLSKDIENFVMDIFKHQAEQAKIDNPEPDTLLVNNPGVNTEEVKIKSLVDAVKGLAKSFEDNKMYGKSNLSKYSSSDDFIDQFKKRYSEKAQKDIDSPKRSKAATPEAKARAESDKEAIRNGLKQVLEMFNEN